MAIRFDPEGHVVVTPREWQEALENPERLIQSRQQGRSANRQLLSGPFLNNISEGGSAIELTFQCFSQRARSFHY